jgi:hypothetical protein
MKRNDMSVGDEGVIYHAFHVFAYYLEVEAHVAAHGQVQHHEEERVVLAQRVGYKR